jgi:hypothetical protein
MHHSRAFNAPCFQARAEAVNVERLDVQIVLQRQHSIPVYPARKRDEFAVDRLSLARRRGASTDYVAGRSGRLWRGSAQRGQDGRGGFILFQ